eukprot:gene14831-biopygen9188
MARSLKPACTCWGMQGNGILHVTNCPRTTLGRQIPRFQIMEVAAKLAAKLAAKWWGGGMLSSGGKALRQSGGTALAA